ncbi:MAG: YCF48-related protein [Acidobacteriota bacterium]
MKRYAVCVLAFLFLLPFLADAQWKHVDAGLPSWGVLDALDATDSLNACAAIRTGRRTLPDGRWDNTFPIAVTADGGASWTLRWLPVEYGATDVAMTDAKHIWCTTSNSSGARIYASSDGGATWTLQYSDTSTADFLDYIEMFNANEGVAVGEKNPALKKPIVVLKTTNGGATWTSVAGSSFPGGASGDCWRRIDFVSMNVGYFYVSHVGKLAKTTDGGATWSEVPFISKVPELIKFYDASLGFAVTTNDAPGVPWIYRTTDGGASWQKFKVNDEQAWANDIEFVPGDPSKVWYTSGKEMFFSTDTGRTWTKQGFDSLNVHGRDIKLVAGGHAWFGCDNGVIYKSARATSIYNIGTAVNEHPAALPSSLRLDQNYPNPFNPSTTIRFALPKSGYASLKMYSVLGEEVATLVSSELSAGMHQAQWDASGQAAGVYFYQLRVGGAVETRSLLLLK